MTEERLFKFILRCLRQEHKPDLHSFTIEIENGKAWVNCECGEVYIHTITYDKDGNEKRTQFAGTAIAATNYLKARNADITTIEQ